MKSEALRMRPNLTLQEANAFIRRHHRHHKPARGCRFVLGAVRADGQLVGVLIASRPVARLVGTRVCEVTRCCTDGTPNACSFLYGAAARIARSMGYDRIQTYLLSTESGVSLKASGWQIDGTTRGGSWKRSWEDSTARQLFLDGSTRRQDQPQSDKVRWARRFVA